MADLKGNEKVFRFGIFDNDLLTSQWKFCLGATLSEAIDAAVEEYMMKGKGSNNFFIAYYVEGQKPIIVYDSVLPKKKLI